MQKRWEKVEHIIDKIIPFTLILLLGIIVFEIFWPTYAEPYHLHIEITDGIVITIFVIDLSFKYHRARNIPQFLKNHWLDIIAIFPFFLVFRLFEGALSVFETFKGTFLEGQKLAHVGLELKEIQVGEKIERLTKEVARAEEGGAKLTELTRSERLARFLRPMVRGSRFAKVAGFFEHPKQHTRQ